MKSKAKTYAEKLRDPRWQRKRLEIMQRDEFRCRECNATEETLNVHHGYYERGLDPWEYDEDTLYTLCEGCHEKATESLLELHRRIGRCSTEDVEMLIGYADGIASNYGKGPAVLKLRSFEHAFGFADAKLVDFRDIIDADLAGRPITDELIEEIKRKRSNP